MAKTVSLQSAFNAGVLDPRLAARTNIDKYYSGVAVGKNVLCTPQGGLKRRPGMKFLYDAGGDGRLASFAFNTEQTYLIAFSNLLLRVFKDGVLQATLVAPWVIADIPALRFTQSADTMILVHPDYAPYTLVRGTTDTSWTLGPISFVNIPQYSFFDDLSPTPVDEVQDVTVSGLATTYTLTLGGNTTSNISYTGVGATDAAAMQVALRALPNTASAGLTVAHSGGNVFRVTFTGDDGGTDWPEMTGDVTAGVGGVIVTTITEGDAAPEDVWSTTRGWPVSVCFYQGRLVFGGSKSRPATFWASQTNDFFDFSPGTGLDDEAVIATLDTDQVNAISAVVSGRHLQIFTSGGEFVEKSLPMTPSNIAVQRQTQYGSIGLQPILIDGATVFVERRGKAVREYLFSFGEDAYTAAPVSILAPHLINTPVDLAARKGTATDDANLVFVVNTDGTMAVLNTLRSENVAGWTPWETDGEILSVAVVVDEVYFLVKRGADYFLEQWDEDTYTDSNVSGTQAASTPVSGLTHLNGETCRFRADGAIMADVTPSGGTITAPRDVVDYEVGLHYDVQIDTMPLNMNFANGPKLMAEKRIVHVQLDLYESNGIVVGGKRMPDRTLDGPLPDIPDPYTGMKEVWPNLGWTHIADLTIEQPDPLPMFIRAISIDIEVSA